jgi:hypothetical protein
MIPTAASGVKHWYSNMVLPNPQLIDALAPCSRNQLVQSYTKMLYSKLWRSPIAAQRTLKQE